MPRATERTLVTPEMAAQMLSKMVRNRKVRPVYLAKYKKDMEQGTFDCFSPISIDVNGELADGQHRLQAIIETGIPQLLYIDTDVPVGTIFDKGAYRTDMQSIYMRGIVDEANSGKAIGSLVRAYTSTKYGSGFILTEDQLGAFISDYSDPISGAIHISRIKQGKGLKFAERAPVQAVLFAAILDGVNTYRLEEFAICVNSGEYHGNGDVSAIRFRNMIINRTIPNQGSYAPAATAIVEHALDDFIHMVPRGKAYKVLSIGEASKPSEHKFIAPCPAIVRDVEDAKEAVL